MMHTMPHGARQASALPFARTLPAQCLPFTAHDASCAPLVEAGECLAIDVTDREPVAGALYLRRFNPSGRKSSELAIVEAVRFRSRLHPAGLWFVGSPMRARDVPAGLRQGERRLFCDGPFTDAIFSDRIVGRVVAIVRDDAADGNDQAQSAQGGYAPALPDLRDSVLVGL